MVRYTPTTDEVRINTVADLTRDDPLYVERLAQFDRWLIEHDRQIAEEAWAEGVRATTTDNFEVAWAERIVMPRNPYREDR